MFVLYICVFDCTCKSLDRLGEQTNNLTNNNNTEKLRDEHTTNRNTGYPAQDPTANKYIRFRLGNNVFLMFLLYVFFLLFSPSLVVVFVLLLYMCLFDCKCKSLNRLGENSKNIKQQKPLREQQKKQKYRISSPRTSARSFCFLLCFSRKSFCFV